MPWLQLKPGMVDTGNRRVRDHVSWPGLPCAGSRLSSLYSVLQTQGHVSWQATPTESLLGLEAPAAAAHLLGMAPCPRGRLGYLRVAA